MCLGYTLGVKMAELQIRKKEKKSGDGIGTMVDFLLANARLVLGVGGAAMLGIATLAVKRLIDRATSTPSDKEAEEKAEQKSIEESWKEAVLKKASPTLRRKEDLEHHCAPLSLPDPSQKMPATGTSQVKASDEIKKIPICFTLQERLLNYHTHHASVPEVQMEEARQLVLDIKKELQEFLHAKHPEMPFLALHLGGSFGNRLPMSCLDHACLIMPLVLEPDLWCVIPGQKTILSDPNFCMVKRIDLEYTSRGSSPWDRFLVGAYLSSRTMVQSLHKTIVGSINWPAIGTVLDCTIKPDITSDELKLEVVHPNGHMIIRILPMAVIKDADLLAHCCATAPAENLWQRSFYKKEVSRLQELDSSDSGIRLKCLQILKGICRDCPSLCHLNSTHLRHILLHLSTESSDWTETALADRFLQVLEELIGYLDKGFLPSYFNDKLNLFSSLKAEDIEELGYGLYQVFSEPDDVLKRER
ncbi:mitochondrial dynamics protein MID49 isoform X2 [Xenopus laevis]|uniref:Mitochondrial dynamics protein MID49 isoform X2 n=1 Tax=Xenopus laevis TaxID=8355 RepID=A0A8J1LWC4_XENLA|nr:mitochondrial dynamics protein MID49 isoform X2 [Xenopus laevis]